MSDPMVSAEQFYKAFGRHEVLKGVDLEVPEGAVVCIIGPSGSGKSTFLRCVNRLETIDAGRLVVDGDLVGYNHRGEQLVELSEREVARHRAKVGMVFQHLNLFPHLTAIENVALAPIKVRHEEKHDVYDRARSLLARVGLEDGADSYPRQLWASSSAW